MKRGELERMLEDMDSLGWFVKAQEGVVPLTTEEKAEAAEQVQSVKYGIVKLMEEYDRRHESLNQAHGGYHMIFISGWIEKRKAKKQAAKQSNARINNLHKNLNAAVMRMQVIIRAEDDKTRQVIAHEAMGNIRRVKHDLAALGMDYRLAEKG